MPKASGAKTGLARRAWLVLAVTVVVAAAAAAAGWFMSARTTDEAVGSGREYAVTELRVRDRTFKLQIADSPEKQQLGLGKRESLRPDDGMVFIYTDEAQRCFWMKDMRFAIDIIWLDKQKEIVHIGPDIRPETYPKTFCPDKSAQYVVELSSGMAARTGLRAGQPLEF